MQWNLIKKYVFTNLAVLLSWMHSDVLEGTLQNNGFVPGTGANDSCKNALWPPD